MQEDIRRALVERVRILDNNRSEEHKLTKDYLSLIWMTKEHGPISIRDMKREHIQNTLNWCLRKSAHPDDEKDGITYSSWIAYFVARLLDPDLE